MASTLRATASIAAAFAVLLLPDVGQATLTININPGTNLAGNAAALAAFNRAADQWEALFSDDITVEVDAEITSFGSSTIIGQASTPSVCSSLENIRNAIVADASDEPDDAVVAGLANLTTADFEIPMIATHSGSACTTFANAKALNISFTSSLADATITFNSDFDFDYDNSDGVDAVDFETVAVHELGHSLGFVSDVDQLDHEINDGDDDEVIARPRALDFFRFADDNNPSNAAEFAANNRTLIPGEAASFDDLANQWSFSTGATNPPGDGRQASHWKDNGITGTLIGVMDPTLASGVVVPISFAEIRALDLIGYESAAIPEASQIVCGVALLLAVGLLKIKATSSAAAAQAAAR